jgi:protein TonB
MYPRPNENIRYRLRFMIALATSLLLVTICFNLPITSRQRPKLWEPQLGQRGLITELQQPPYLLPPITNTGISPAGSPAVDPVLVALPTEILSVQVDTRLESADTWKIETQTVPILEYAEIMPEIPGGIGAYYILIEYPEEAISQGLEGSLSLVFTVNQDGTTSDVLIERSLHALLDSAAVQALRRTRFIPGRHQGKTARVRMRLPVRFQLIEPSDSTYSG